MSQSQAQERRDSGFYRQLGRLFIPVVIQNLLNAAVNSADVIMLNFVGQDAISAVSLATQYANILFMVFYGLGTGATMLCAQYYGKGRYARSAGGGGHCHALFHWHFPGLRAGRAVRSAMDDAHFYGRRRIDPPGMRIPAHHERHLLVLGRD